MLNAIAVSKLRAVRVGSVYTVLLLLASANAEEESIRRLRTTHLHDAGAKEWNVGSALKKHRIHKHRTAIKEMLAKPGGSGGKVSAASYDWKADPKGPDSPSSDFSDCGMGPNKCTDQWKELSLPQKYDYLGQNWGEIPKGVTRSDRCAHNDDKV
jgi:hypothetical protein